jgi:hypothetical protein
MTHLEYTLLIRPSVVNQVKGIGYVLRQFKASF